MSAVWRVVVTTIVLSAGCRGLARYPTVDATAPTDGSSSEARPMDITPMDSTAMDGTPTDTATPILDAGPPEPKPLCNASQWCLSYPTDTHYEQLNAIWRSPNGTIYVVGDHGALLLKEGSHWRRVALPTKATLHGIWGSSDHDVYAVGTGGTMLHYDGKAWSSVDLGIERTGRTVLRGVWGAGPKDIYAIGGGATLLHYNGTNWQRLPLPDALAETPTSFNAIWGSGADDIVVVGSAGVALRYDGAKWRLLTSGGAALYSVWGHSAKDVYIGGEGGTLLHCDTEVCWPIHTGVSRPLHALGGTSDGSLLALGDYGTALRCIGEVCTPVPVESDYFLNALTTTSTHPIAVGSQGHILEYRNERWSKLTGGHWSMQKIWALDATNVYAIVSPAGLSSRSELIHFDGTRWQSLLERHGAAAMRNIWASTPDDLFVVGAGGVIMHYDGNRWSRMPSDVNDSLGAIWGTSADNVYAAGTNGTILRFDGHRWQSESTGSDSSFNALWGVDALRSRRPSAGVQRHRVDQQNTSVHRALRHGRQCVQ